MATYFRLMILFPVVAWAHIGITLEKPTPEGLLQEGFLLKEDQDIYVSNTNYFDDKNKLFGKFKILNRDELQAVKLELNRIIKILKKAHAKYPPTSKLNSTNFRHTSFLRLNQSVIMQGNPLFERTKNAYDQLKVISHLEPSKGAHVRIEDKEKVLEITNETEKTLFSINKIEKCTVELCQIEDFGVFYFTLPATKEHKLLKANKHSDTQD